MVEGEVALVWHVLPLLRTRICVTCVWGRNYMSYNLFLFCHPDLKVFMGQIGASLLKVLPSVDLFSAFSMIKEAEDGSVLLMM